MLHIMAYSLTSSEAILSTTRKLHKILRVKINAFLDFMMSTRPEEETLRLELKWKQQNLIFKSAMEILDHWNRNTCVARDTTGKELLIDRLEGRAV